MKPSHAALSIALAAAAAAGCSKSTDATPIAQEANGLVKNYQERFKLMQSRVVELAAKVQKAGPVEVAVLRDAGSRLATMKRALDDAPGRIAGAKDVVELRKINSQLLASLRDSGIEIGSKLDTVAAAIERAETQPSAPRSE